MRVSHTFAFCCDFFFRWKEVYWYTLEINLHPGRRLGSLGTPPTFVCVGGGAQTWFWKLGTYQLLGIWSPAPDFENMPDEGKFNCFWKKQVTVSGGTPATNFCPGGCVPRRNVTDGGSGAARRDPALFYHWRVGLP